MTQILGKDNQGLVFEIVSARISDGTERKHVIYTLQVRHISGSDDISPSVIERRYSNFLTLYNDLRTEHPQLMTTLTFPKKVLMGNFDSELISLRTTGFAALLQHIAQDSKLRASKSLIVFLQHPELERAKELLRQKEFALALPGLESSFKLLNKVFTDRSPVVLLALCRLLACSISIPGFPNAEKWANLAVHRYDGVSDSDLLELYGPILSTCVEVWGQAGRNKDMFEQRLGDLKRQGLRINDKALWEVVNMVEEKLLKS